MHGEINLTSELGQGTTTTFWIPFNKPQSTKRSPLLADTSAAPERLWSDATRRSGCLSASQSVVGDPQSRASYNHLNSPTRNSSERTSSEECSSEEPVQEEIDRKNTHVLIVEDKYVTLPSYINSSVSMNPVAKKVAAVL